jgi:CheY-like chemotaxis protein
MVQKPLVMVVESESSIRLEIVEMVTEAGDAVIDTPNAGAAIEILRNRSDIRAVFTDISVER